MLVVYDYYFRSDEARLLELGDRAYVREWEETALIWLHRVKQQTPDP